MRSWFVVSLEGIGDDDWYRRRETDVLEVGAIKERNMALAGYCETEACGHFYVFDVEVLLDAFGPKYRVPEYAKTQFGLGPFDR
jgi:hypothetical protein